MARRKHIEIVGQINLFDYLVEIQQPKVVIETMIEKIDRLLRDNQYSQSKGIVQWLVWGNDETYIHISSEINKKALYDSLARILHKYLFKIEEIGSFGKSKHYYISGFMEKRERSSDEHIKTDLRTISQYAPKLLRERTERYLNEPFNLPLVEAFKKAACEYKHPSKRLRKALETGNFKEFLPGEYVKKKDKSADRALSQAA